MWYHPDTPLAEKSGEFGQRHGRLRAENVHEHQHEVDAGVMTRHPAEVAPQSVVLEVGEPLEREQVSPRQDEREPDSEREIRVDLERDDLLRTGERVNLLGGTWDAVHALHGEVRDEQNDRECRVEGGECNERVEQHFFSPFAVVGFSKICLLV